MYWQHEVRTTNSKWKLHNQVTLYHPDSKIPVDPSNLYTEEEQAGVTIDPTTGERDYRRANRSMLYGWRTLLGFLRQDKAADHMTHRSHIHNDKYTIPQRHNNYTLQARINVSHSIMEFQPYTAAELLEILAPFP